MTRRAPSPSTRGAAVALMIVPLLLAGCTPVTDTDPPGTGLPAPTATVNPTAPGTVPDEPDPEFVDGGDASDNAPFAQFVVEQLAESHGERPASAQVADVLVANGFDRALLEVTPDRTPLGLPTDVISFAVRFADECIIGEVRGVEVTTAVAPVLATGRCLVGSDASID
ncbi:DUF6993 domain-containing protein [Microcella sp.]|uniref:DUF6993 domain-containing protein n=1 Tax=Microcella sp. TaxID=1913979 RepID=UPI00391D53BF